MTSTLARLPSLTAATVALAVLAALARFRPEFPEMPDTLSAPVTTTFLQALALVAAWLLAALVLLLLLVKSLHTVRVSRHANLDGHNASSKLRERSRLRWPTSAQGHVHSFDEPRLLVVAPPEAQPAAPQEQCDGGPSELSEPAIAVSGPLPLISLLGPLTIDGGKQSRRGLRARALELIAFLALRREGAQRDEILEALWPGDDPKRSRHRLYQAVRDARRLLGDAVASERDRYRLDRARVRVDVDELQSLLDTIGQGTTNHVPDLEKALGFFREEPLSGSDFPWAESDVRRLRGIYVGLLERVGRTRLGRGEARGALDLAERGITVDLFHEGLWRLALEAEGELGLREAIDDRYQRLCALLEERLGLEPERKTRALYLDLLSQD
jgi:DNA-binding SARP family transcriptional activator